MKFHKKSVFLALAAAAAMMTASGCGKAQIGYVDGERLMKEAPQLTAIAEEGNNKLAEAKKSGTEELTKDKESMSDEDFQKAEQQEQAKMAGIQQQYSMQMKQKLDAAVEGVVKAKKLDVVLDSEKTQKTVIQGGTDITDDVIQKLQ
jgi:outer membrane protein